MTDTAIAQPPGAISISRSSRRRFLTAIGAGGSLLASRSARAADSRIEVLLDEPIGIIAPELHGHFAEHIGGVVYDGIWVGEGREFPIPEASARHFSKRCGNYTRR